jgi:hypothetical protein
MINREMKGLVPLTWIHAKSDSFLEDWSEITERGTPMMGN